MAKKNEIIISSPNDSNSSNLSIIPPSRTGVFEEGYDKLGRPYEKKLDDNGLYTKKEVLKDGTHKLTIKQMNKK